MRCGVDAFVMFQTDKYQNMLSRLTTILLSL